MEEQIEEVRTQQLVTGHPMITQANDGAFKLKTYVGQAKSDELYNELGTVIEALSHEGWKKSMQEENQALKDDNTLTLFQGSQV